MQMPLQLTEQETHYIEDLQELATKKGQSLERILELFLSLAQEVEFGDEWAEKLQHSLQAQPSIQGTPAAKILEAIETFTFKGEKDVSARSREILDDEYGAYLESRLNTDAE